MDAAISKVARDMARASPELAEEFYIMGLGIRAGEARMVALRNLALRVNLEDLNDLVSMLIQADRFGTSLAESLRIQSDVMRGKRLQRAEEMAAKIPTKMLMPLVGFIFPVLLMVLLGPAAIQIGKVFV
jgi:tight adherence protein C